MARYLVRIANTDGYRPDDARRIAKKIRDILGSRETIGNLRVSGLAIEFDLFADNHGELESRKSALEKQIGKLVTLKLLDQTLTRTQEKIEVLREGVQLFNEERFWESHEVWERIWHPAKGAERDIVQGLILSAAGLVHAQKDRNETSLNMLRRAREKLGAEPTYEGVNLDDIRQNLDRILRDRHPEAFKIKP